MAENIYKELLYNFQNSPLRVDGSLYPAGHPYADINWNLLMKKTKKNTVSFKEISKYPAVSRDLALLVDKCVEFKDIEKVAFQSEKKLLKKVELFDVYEGKNLEAGKKSYAVNFLLQDETKTMNDKQTDVVMQKIISNLEIIIFIRLICLN